MNKQGKHKNENAELRGEETASGTDSNLGSTGNVSFDSKLEEGGNSPRKDAHLETEQLTYSCKKKKRKGCSLIDEKQSELVVESEVNVSLESGFKDEVNFLVNDTRLDKEEKNKRKDGEAVGSAASADNEEFGETAGAEVGAVKNESPRNPVELNMATGETEVDQIKSPGKSKKDKDSRSMKLFKVALADFVKEVLKPSWQQGNMSKEVFKTIVKKTVDKVSGAMKSHQIPKSRAKIDQYIESSQRKLTKLVMGYVDKYVNV